MIGWACLEEALLALRSQWKTFNLFWGIGFPTKYEQIEKAR